MREPITVGLERDGLDSLLERVAGLGTDTAGLMADIAGILEDGVQENFQQEGRPSWAGLAPSTLLGRSAGGKILQRSGKLARSITSASDTHAAQVGSNLLYAAIHHFGGKTKPHIIRPRDKQALAWPGGRHPVREVQHPGSLIPARPIFVMTGYEADEIAATLHRYLTGG